MRMLVSALIFAGFLSGCATESFDVAAPQVGGGPRVVPASELSDAAAVRFRHLDAVNALRLERGLAPLAYSQSLNSAALTHARDMALQSRAWHFGSDRSNPQSRARRAGYGGRVVGENIAESFEGELDTLQNWLRDPQTAALMIAPNATSIGLGWFRQRTGKLWWVQLVGAPGTPGR